MCGAASSRVLLSAATYAWQPSHLYLQQHIRTGRRSIRHASVVISRHTLEVVPFHLPVPRCYGTAFFRPQQHPPRPATHLLAPSKRSTAVKLRRAASRLAMRGDTSSVRLEQHSYVRLMWPQARHSTWLRV